MALIGFISSKNKKALALLKEKGLWCAFKIMFFKLIRKRIKQYSLIKKLFDGKSGIEIGGPTELFRKNSLLPLYNIVKELDSCNFSSTTIWQGNTKGGKTYNYYKNKNGIQYISEATDLELIPNENYDFVISSNCLEHIANPLKAIEEWIGILKRDGLLLLILPNKDYCFDHDRPVTRFTHLLEDLHTDVKENDLTHLDEILELHDLEMDRPAGNFEQFKERSLKNSENRALHHHVFDVPLLKEIFDYFNMEILMTDESNVHVILGKKNVA
jgi:SAM-dependent methyltransferase